MIGSVGGRAGCCVSFLCGAREGGSLQRACALRVSVATQRAQCSRQWHVSSIAHAGGLVFTDSKRASLCAGPGTMLVGIARGVESKDQLWEWPSPAVADGSGTVCDGLADGMTRMYFLLHWLYDLLCCRAASWLQRGACRRRAGAMSAKLAELLRLRAVQAAAKEQQGKRRSSYAARSNGRVAGKLSARSWSARTRCPCCCTS